MHKKEQRLQIRNCKQDDIQKVRHFVSYVNHWKLIPVTHTGCYFIILVKPVF